MGSPHILRKKTASTQSERHNKASHDLHPCQVVANDANQEFWHEYTDEIRFDNLKV